MSQQPLVSDDQLVPRGFPFQGLAKPLYVGGAAASHSAGSRADGSVTDGVARLCDADCTEFEEAVELRIHYRGATPGTLLRAAELLHTHLEAAASRRARAVVINDGFDGEEYAASALLAYLVTYRGLSVADAVSQIRTACFRNSTMVNPRPLSTRAPLAVLNMMERGLPSVDRRIEEAVSVSVVEGGGTYARRKRSRYDDGVAGAEPAVSSGAALRAAAASSTVSDGGGGGGDEPAAAASARHEGGGNVKRFARELEHMAGFLTLMMCRAGTGAPGIILMAAHHAARVAPVHLWSAHDLASVVVGGASYMSSVPQPERLMFEDLQSTMLELGLRLRELDACAGHRDFRRHAGAHGLIMHVPCEDRCLLVHHSRLGPVSTVDYCPSGGAGKSAVRCHMDFAGVLEGLARDGWLAAGVKRYAVELADYPAAPAYAPAERVLRAHDGPALYVDYSYDRQRWFATYKHAADADDADGAAVRHFEDPLDLTLSADGRPVVCAAMFVPVSSRVRVHGLLETREFARSHTYFRSLPSPTMHEAMVFAPVRCTLWPAAGAPSRGGVRVPVGEQGQFIFEYLGVTADHDSANVTLENGRSELGTVFLRVIRSLRPGDPFVLYLGPKLKQASGW